MVVEVGKSARSRDPRSHSESWRNGCKNRTQGGLLCCSSLCLNPSCDFPLTVCLSVHCTHQCASCCVSFTFSLSLPSQSFLLLGK